MDLCNWARTRYQIMQLGKDPIPNYAGKGKGNKHWARKCREMTWAGLERQERRSPKSKQGGGYVSARVVFACAECGCVDQREMGSFKVHVLMFACREGLLCGTGSLLRKKITVCGGRRKQSK